MVKRDELIKKKFDDLEERVSYYRNAWMMACERNDHLVMRLEETKKYISSLRSALQWYADANYDRVLVDRLGYMDPSEWQYEESEVIQDAGKRARDTLVWEP